MSFRDQGLIDTLKGGGVAVIPTDTIYGVVGQALKPETVARIYDLKRRAPEKPFLILISDISEFAKFSIHLGNTEVEELKKLWQERPTSVVLDCAEKKFAYLHRGTETLAFRLPQNMALQELLRETGPLIAPSANLEGQPPAENINEAENYFGTGVDIYMDGGTIKGKPSRLVKLHKDKSISILRA